MSAGGDGSRPGEFEDANEAFRRLELPFLSVVIPTFRRVDTLRQVLGEVSRQVQAAPAPVEVVVCDDGSADGTVACLRDACATLPMPMAWVSLQVNRGPARARNAALRRARGEVVLLLGDDIVPGPGLLEAHLGWHRGHPAPEDALLGSTRWPEAMHPDAFMRWLETGGRAFFMNYADIPEHTALSGMHFYTCNVSFKRGLAAAAGGFDERFPFASHEDLEFGMRLERAGMRMSFDRHAVGYHWHRLDQAGTFRRVYRMGNSAVRFWKCEPLRDAVWRRVGRRALAAVFSLTPVRAAVRAWAHRAALAAPPLRARPLAWLCLLHCAFWCGVADGRAGSTDRDWAGLQEPPVNGAP